jgi:HAE1 family hydrophobic/amphiphilic exporter-1
MISWASRRPAVIWAFAVALVLAGAVSFTRLPLATRTRIELPQLSVQTAWPGASPELIEAYITSPIEAALQPVRGVRKISSESGEGGRLGGGNTAGSRIRIDLDPGVDVAMTRLAILERLELLRPELPLGVSPPRVTNYVPEELSEEPLLQYTVSGPYTPGTLARVMQEEVEPRLGTVEGVAGITSSGMAETGISVVYDATRLRQLGITPATLQSALAGAREVEALGFDQRGSLERPVVLRDQPGVVQDLERLPVRGPGGRVFLLGELAEVYPEEDTRGMFNRFNGQTAVTVSITRLAGSDAIQTAARVQEELARLQPALPPGIRFHLRSDESEELADQLRDLALRGSLAFGAVMLVLVLTLRSARAVGMVMGSAAVSIAGTALALYLLDIPANLLTLAGLGMGIGVLVQNGLIVVERLRSVPDTPEARAAAGRDILPAVAGSTLTTAVVLFPFLYLQGNARAAFVPFAAAFAIGLGWSVVASVVMIPAVGGNHGMRTGHWPRLARFYDRVLIRLLRWRYAVLVFALAGLGVLGWGFATRVERLSFGAFGTERTTISVFVSFPRGSDPESLDRAIREFEAIAVGREGVEQVQAQGYSGFARMEVRFSREAAYTPIPAMMQDELTQRAVLVGGATVSVFGRGQGFSSGGVGGTTGFRIKLLGFSFDGVEQLARDLQRRLEQIPRVRNVNINAGSFWMTERAMSVAIQPDRAALARAGVTATEFALAVAREVRGPQGGTRLELDGEEVVVTLKARGARERSLLELEDALVPNRAGAPVRVRDLARVDEREGLSMISREDQQYVRIVSYDFRGPARLAQRTHDGFMKSITVPPGYSVDDDRFAWQEDDSGRLLWLVFGAGLVLVILAVALVFNSAWAALVVFLSLPIALAGVAAIFWATGTPFGREAAVGLILVIGLAVNQTILLVDAALQRRAGGQADGRAVRRLTPRDILFAAHDRAGMVVMVTLVTMASLIPLAIGTDPDSLFGSIALATAGGTVAGTVGALVLMPVVLLGRRQSKMVEGGRRR